MKTSSNHKKYSLLGGLSLLNWGVYAANTPPADAPAITEQSLLLFMGTLAVLLMLLIFFLLAYPFYANRKTNVPENLTKMLLLGGLLTLGFQADAQTVAVAADSAAAATLADDMKVVIEQGVAAKLSTFDVAYWTLFLIIFIEMVVIFGLIGRFIWRVANNTLAKQNEARTQSGKASMSWWDKFNDTVPFENEKDMQMEHNYDGIKELDNKLPPWWVWGFYLTIFFSAVYLWQYHIAHSKPLSAEELQIALDKGEEEKAAFLKKSANAVDENNVKLLTASADIASGKAVFNTNCKVCHGGGGEGGVGPNLTDKFWIHGGGIKDLFKTIKYGVDGKGMKSWKEDLSPQQIAQVASYIKTLVGTNPPNAKEAQGEEYVEPAEAAPVAADSTAKAGS